MKKDVRGNPIFTEAERVEASNKLNVQIRTAALTLDHQGRISYLTEKADISYVGLMNAIRRGWLTSLMAAAIESAVGKDVMSKEMLCPHKFTK